MIAALKLPRKEVFEFTCVPLQNFLCKFRDRGLMWATKLCEKNIFITMDTLLLQNSYYIMYIWPAYLIFLTGISRKSQNSKLNYIMKSQRHHYSRFVDTSVRSYFGLNRVWLSFLQAATRGVKTVDRVRLQSTFIRAHKIYLCQSVAFLLPLINEANMYE